MSTSTTETPSAPIESNPGQENHIARHEHFGRAGWWLQNSESSRSELFPFLGANPGHRFLFEPGKHPDDGPGTQGVEEISRRHLIIERSIECNAACEPDPRLLEHGFRNRGCGRSGLPRRNLIAACGER
jgi:hypothetical protein